MKSNRKSSNKAKSTLIEGVKGNNFIFINESEKIDSSAADQVSTVHGKYCKLRKPLKKYKDFSGNYFVLQLVNEVNSANSNIACKTSKQSSTCNVLEETKKRKRKEYTEVEKHAKVPNSTGVSPCFNYVPQDQIANSQPVEISKTFLEGELEMLSNVKTLMQKLESQQIKLHGNINTNTTEEIHAPKLSERLDDDFEFYFVDPQINLHLIGGGNTNEDSGRFSPISFL